MRTSVVVAPPHHLPDALDSTTPSDAHHRVPNETAAALPRKAGLDALHVAIAAVHGMHSSDLGEAMSTDSVVDEVRAIRDAIAREHDYDLASICRAIRERARVAGVQTVTLPPRPVSRLPHENAAQTAVAGAK